MFRISIYTIILACCFSACTSDVAKSFEPKSSALGKMNEIVVIADQDDWEGAIGDTFRYYFASAYPILPAPEPLFDLRHFTTDELLESPLRKELRTYAFLADLSDEESSTTKMVKRDLGEVRFKEAAVYKKINTIIGKNKWARGQQLFYFFGTDEATTAASISEHFAVAAKRINNHDYKQLKSTLYSKGLNLGHAADLKDQFGINVDIPVDFRLAKKEDNLRWLRMDTDKETVNLVFQKFAYNDKNQLSKAHLMKLRNEFGKEYVTTDVKGAYMVINDEDLPVFEYVTKIDDQYTLEIRGVWETENDFFGGPFISYLILNESKNELIYVDAFVYAPGEDKRDLMMQMDLAAKSISFNNKVQ